MDKEFPSSPVVRIWCFHCRGLGLIPGQKTKIHRPHGTAEKKKKKNLGPEQTIFQMCYIEGQQAYEKKFIITNHRGNANQNHNKMSLHTCQNDYHQKDDK